MSDVDETRDGEQDVPPASESPEGADAKAATPPEDAASAPPDEAEAGDGEQADEEDASGEADAPGRPGLGRALAMDPADLPGAIEALVLVSDKPVAPVRLARLTRSDVDAVKAALAELREHYADRGLVLDEVAGGYQFRTHPRYAGVVRGLIQQKPVRLTRAQLEVLSIIAYRQPVTRPEVEDVRGVDSGSALRVLLERGLIRIIGKRDEAGRPMLYATTPDFLSLFGLKSLRDLPTLKEFTELSDESRDMFERRIGERAPLEGFTEDASDARAAAEREAALREQASHEPEDAEDFGGTPAAEEAPVEAPPGEGAPAEDDADFGGASRAEDAEEPPAPSDAAAETDTDDQPRRD